MKKEKEEGIRAWLHFALLFIVIYVLVGYIMKESEICYHYYVNHQHFFVDRNVDKKRDVDKKIDNIIKNLQELKKLR